MSSVPELIQAVKEDFQKLADSTESMEQYCISLQDRIRTQLTSVQNLTTEFKKLETEGSPGFASTPIAPVPEPANAGVSTVQETAKWDVTKLAESANSNLSIVLLAEIIDLSVICSTTFSPDGLCVAIGSNRTLRVYRIKDDMFSFEHTVADNNDSNFIRTSVWTNDSKRIICGLEDQSILVFNMVTKTLDKTITGNHGEVFSIQVSPDDKFFAAATGYDFVTLYDLETYEEIAELKRSGSSTRSATSLAISEDSKHIAVGYSDNYVTYWQLDPLVCLCEQELHEKGIYSLKFHGTNRLITSSLDTSIRIWELTADNKFTLVSKLVGHDDFVLSIAISADKRWLLSGSKDKTAILTDLTSNTMIYKIAGHDNTVISVDFCPDGKMFCTGSGDRSVRIWGCDSE